MEEKELLKKILGLIIEPRKIIFHLNARGFLNWMTDDIHIRIMYRLQLGKKLNLKNPTTFNEKLQWFKLHDRNPEYIKMVDKYAVREYIKNTIGEEHLIPLIGVYDNFDEINFDELPNKFVLKTTHDSGGVVICTDKSKLNLKQAKKKINKSLKRNYYWHAREWPYKNVKPRIVCEKFMLDESGTELKDYKFMCFNGEAKCSFVCLNRNSPKGLNVDFYDMDWKPMPFERKYPNSGTMILKPKTFDKMVEFAERIAQDKTFVRVDFYEINGYLYFGEITFYPGSGFEKFEPDLWDKILGSWIKIPDIKM
jgi:hypothetical protein